MVTHPLNIVLNIIIPTITLVCFIIMLWKYSLVVEARQTWGSVRTAKDLRLTMVSLILLVAWTNFGRFDRIFNLFPSLDWYAITQNYIWLPHTCVVAAFVNFFYHLGRDGENQ
jgi:hypothetical protein